jgi:hypothetical protein
MKEKSRNLAGWHAASLHAADEALREITTVWCQFWWQRAIPSAGGANVTSGWIPSPLRELFFYFLP